MVKANGKNDTKLLITLMSEIGEGFNLRKFLWMGELQPYSRQLETFILQMLFWWIKWLQGSQNTGDKNADFFVKNIKVHVLFIEM